MGKWLFVWELRPADREKWLMVEVEGEGILKAWYSKQNDFVFDRVTTGRLMRWRYAKEGDNGHD